MSEDGIPYGGSLIVPVGPFYARQGMVFDRFDNVVLVGAAATCDGWTERVAADLNLVESIARLADRAAARAAAFDPLSRVPR